MDAWQALPSSIRRARFFGVADPRSLPATEGEGFVLRWPDGTRAKVKLDEYVRLHRLIFGASTKTVWAALRAGETPEATTVDLPEELRAWITETAAGLRAEFAAVRTGVAGFVEEARQLGLVGGPRKEFAAWVNAHAEIRARDWMGQVFRVADGRSVDDEIWRKVEPEFAQPEWARREDGE